MTDIKRTGFLGFPEKRWQTKEKREEDIRKQNKITVITLCEKNGGTEAAIVNSYCKL